MAIFKCKMCGGDLEITPNQTVVECEYCGSTQTLPKIDDDRKANLYDRANHFRRNNEFDKAASVYEKLLAEDGTDAEAYWSLVLCRYGIEYVEDPSTHKRVPTVNRAQYTSIFDDDNYKQALAHAEISRKLIYEDEAKAINEIQKGILAISQKEAPFDVFICYKETDTDGRRTQDSVLANDLYHQLTQEGFKVFFSRITLEDKLGVAYEPYIFAALNSAKVMVVLGTKPEYFNAVWVKNEWSRYLAIVKQSAGKKVLIPAYRDMDPYDLPEEFSHLQAQDMSKLGFMQDLIRGVKKILQADKSPNLAQPVVQQTVVSGGSANVDNLYKRAKLFLEDGNFASAAEYADKILDEDAEYAPAYMVRVLAAHQCHSEQELEDKRADASLPNDADLGKAVRFAQEGSSYSSIADRVAENAAFARAVKPLNIALDAKNGVEANAASVQQTLKQRVDAEGTDDADENAYKTAAAQLKKLGTYPHASECVSLCEKLAALMPLLQKYKAQSQALDQLKGTDDWNQYKRVSTEFAKLGGFRDSVEKSKSAAQAAKDTVQRLYDRGVSTIKSAKTYDENDKGLAILKPLVDEILIDEAVKLHEQKKVEIANAIKAEEERKEAEKRKAEAERAAAQAAAKRKKIIAAIVAVIAVVAVAVYVFVITPMQKYNTAKDLYTAGKYEEAYAAFATLTGYKDVDTMLATDENLKAAARREPYTKAGNYVTYGHYEQDNSTANGQEPIEWLVLDYDAAGNRALLISRYGLEARCYDEGGTYPTWEKSDIRAWLNGDFVNAAFTTEEQAGLKTVTISTPSYGGNSGGADTQDRIWLLSREEATQYFKTDDERKTTATAYANANGAYEADNGCCWWWLRSPGYFGSNASLVLVGGSLYYSRVNRTDDVVRPAFWLDLSSL